MTEGKHKPRFCPGCGKPLVDECGWIQECAPVNKWSEYYDCYCDECGWSGDISPDIDVMEEGSK